MRGSAGLPMRETGSKESVQDSVGIDNAIRREQNTVGFSTPSRLAMLKFKMPNSSRHGALPPGGPPGKGTVRIGY